MATAVSGVPMVSTRPTILKRLGIPPQLAWGYLGLLLFMIGDGIEAGYLAPFLNGIGVSQVKIALMFTLYGLAAALAARLSGALADTVGARVVMWLGVAIWAFFEVIFLVFGVAFSDRDLLVLSYFLRGLGYPLFAYGFLVCVAAVTPPKRLGSAVGWFWFAFTAGLPTLGSLLASYTIPLIGQYATFWCSLVFVIIGGIIMLLGLPRAVGAPPVRAEVQHHRKALFAAISIAWEKPKVVLGSIVRMINTAPQFGFLLFLPSFYVGTLGFTLSQWLQVLSWMFFSNIICDLALGMIGDRLGWRRTVAYIGGIGCTITTLLLYYLPLRFPGNYLVAVVSAMLYGATLAGYVPLSAIMPCLAPENPGAAISMLNLGAGASVWLGPAIVGCFLSLCGIRGVIWIFAALYALSAILALFLTAPEYERPDGSIETQRPLGGFSFAAAGSLLGHPPIMTLLPEEIELILFDLGGTIYDDETFTRALLRAARELNPSLEEHEFWAVYDEQRGQSSGSLRTAIAKRFVPGGDRATLVALAHKYWEYPASTLYPDVKPALSSLAQRFKLGLVANAGAAAKKALRRDGLDRFFSVITLSEEAGIEKPDEAIFRLTLEHAGVPADRAIHVGNRLDNDIRPAQRIGMKTIWLLRGDSPPAPTLEQLCEPDAVIISLNGVGVALSRLRKENLSVV
ncbi:MAG: RbtT/DalT/CsbX family MFS transporter [Chthoniobacterales bacterium]